jgi:hypothetical protein
VAASKGKLLRTLCTVCGRSVAVMPPRDGVRRIRAHCTVARGAVECSASGTVPEVTLAAEVAGRTLPPYAPDRRSTPGPLGTWSGPRRWEDADLPLELTYR